MQPKKYDSFSPKRASNIDGFYARPSENRPRQPVFRSPSAKPQPKLDTLSNMPSRSQPQSVLASANQPQAAPPLDGGGAMGQGGRERRRGAHGAPVGAAGEPPRRRDKHSKRDTAGKPRAHRIRAIILGLILMAGLLLGFKFYRNIANLTGNNNPFSALSVFTPAHLDNDNGRVNILVAGNSADDAGHNGGTLTDSIMVLSVDTNKNTALMLSVPRDLWVNIPGVGHGKINSAFPNGGMSKLKRVVETNLGMPIHYQVLVNYGAFRDLVNAVGGINITVKSTDPRGIYDPSLDYTSRYCCALAKYPNGPVALNGKQALNLARARGDAYGSYGYAQSDFTRTQYQRQMLLAIKDKASQSSVIANPFKVASIIDAVGQNVKTSLQVNEIQTLYTYMKKVDNSKIDSYNINTLKGKDSTMLENFTSPDGQSALVPALGVDDFSDIKKQIKKILTADPITKEGANVVILNGTSTVGLASGQQVKLSAKGISVYASDAPAEQPTTTIIDNSNGMMPNTLNYLKAQYKATIVTNRSLTLAYPNADFIMILGQSAVPKPAATSPTQ